MRTAPLSLIVRTDCDIHVLVSIRRGRYYLLLHFYCRIFGLGNSFVLSFLCLAWYWLSSRGTPSGDITSTT